MSKVEQSKIHEQGEKEVCSGSIFYKKKITSLDSNNESKSLNNTYLNIIELLFLF